MMKNGGNQKLRKFFEYYGMSKDAPMDFKFKTKAGFYYRELVNIPELHQNILILIVKSIS